MSSPLQFEPRIKCFHNFRIFGHNGSSHHLQQKKAFNYFPIFHNVINSRYNRSPDVVYLLLISFRRSYSFIYSLIDSSRGRSTNNIYHSSYHYWNSMTNETKLNHGQIGNRRRFLAPATTLCSLRHPARIYYRACRSVNCGIIASHL